MFEANSVRNSAASCWYWVDAIGDDGDGRF